MRPRSLIHVSIATSLSRLAAIFTIAASSLALAQAVPTIGAGGDAMGEHAPYRGTAVSYGHALSAYNPTPEVTAWSHRIGLMPEWHFTNFFYVRSRFFLSQEFTKSDYTKYLNEVELSDLWLDAVWGGYTERVTGIRVGADLRTTFPTSKTSQAATRIMTIGPSANVSRNFKVLSGLTFVYSARITGRINQSSTRMNQGPRIINCQSTLVDACVDNATGARNVVADVIHGPTVLFNPHARVNISATFLMQRGWLAPLGSVPPEFASVPALQTQSGPTTRDFWAFSFGVTYTPVDPVSLTLGAFSFTEQVGADGRYVFPIFNRSTVVSLDATFDIEATVASFTKEKKK